MKLFTIVIEYFNLRIPANYNILMRIIQKCNRKDSYDIWNVTLNIVLWILVHK